VPRPENAALYRRYEALAEATQNVTFVGRLATYKYYNMDQVVGQALAVYKRLKQRYEDAAAASRDALALAAAVGHAPVGAGGE
jgi:UDP-galactopyranose mutase